MNIDFDNDYQEENEIQQQHMKKIKSPKKINSKSQKKSNLILYSENDFNSNSLIQYLILIIYQNQQIYPILANLQVFTIKILI